MGRRTQRGLDEAKARQGEAMQMRGKMMQRNAQDASRQEVDAALACIEKKFASIVERQLGNLYVQCVYRVPSVIHTLFARIVLCNNNTQYY